MTTYKQRIIARYEKLMKEKQDKALRQDSGKEVSYINSEIMGIEQAIKIAKEEKE